MNSSHTIIRALLRTEKGVRLQDDKKYLFSVSKSANKIQIKKAVEDIYKVKVLNVNTQMVPGKLKRVRTQLGRTPDWKKAVVTLKEGQKIDLA
ncbi:MAG: 50S ribosomal protein L23 [Candidatus Omnitrophica bacterium CG07_land_8_20_14_0_80_50_8]|nr:MAG: 50S ribosomal protein L23 [Candidatus Omnitrophica bacterium CG1_02_49_16]PIU40174.1 MAG: 50S ribosomal protein L23 [Candidatus Omnitrophica bacterium CG07_land_8_20_14_0_80_50_8]